MKNVSQVLREAAELLGEKGWIQGQLINVEHGMPAGFCAIGAIQYVTGTLCGQGQTGKCVCGDDLIASDRCATAIDRLAQEVHIDFPLVGIPYWNDAPERTAEDVILAMKRAASND